MAPSYVSLFSQLAKAGNVRFSQLSQQHRAIVVVLILLAVSALLVAIAVYTNHAYIPMGLLGVFYGVLGSYPVITFLSPSIQSAAGGFLSGVTVSNMATKLALAKTWVTSVGTGIASLTEGLPFMLNPTMSTGITVCIWMTIITTLLIVVVNLYFAHSKGSEIGTQTK